MSHGHYTSELFEAVVIMVYCAVYVLNYVTLNTDSR